ncbi:hypothetical protein HOP50_16g78040 [Chloropicon primus]|uniref:Uncharacterized protein n=2 Tax=Chloropicon primus TaxID=1764295 RepID=A0A5B8MWQ3_9CHLO|nr:hypothetical protein A3770_16p77760 [Chloropicon primus]UPR04463.1 hypothetical protein HOP50_16g78040 [Chloropicon primus]|eukprot:QDZ25258.1 hypothetical protein A3770_16p77760 [Chloropicon primus]
MAVTRGASKRRRTEAKHALEGPTMSGDTILRIVALQGLRSFEDLGRVAAVSTTLRDTVNESLACWIQTAEHMGRRGDKLTKGNANKILLLSAQDLRSLSYEAVELDRIRVAHLYDATDVMDVARAKYGMTDGLKSARRKRVQRSGAIRATQARKRKASEVEQAERRQVLCAAMHRLDSTLQPRADSRLCNGWIRDGHGDPDSIAITMLEMRWLHSTKFYKKRLRYLREEHRAFAGWLPPHEYRAHMDDISADAKRDTVKHYEESGRASEIPPSLRR